MAEKPRINLLQICKVFSPIKGGVQIAVQRFTEQLSGSVNSTIITTAEGPSACEENKNGLIVRCKSYGQILSMPIAPSLIANISKHSKGANVIINHSPFPLADIALLFCYKKIRSAKLVIFWHSDIVSQRVSSVILAPLMRLLLSRADAVFVSNPVLIETSNFLPKYREKCAIVPIGFNPNEEVLKTAKDDGYFLYVGRHVAYKGLSVLIEAVKISGVNLVMLGNGPLLRKHKKEIVKLGISNQITLIEQASDYDVEIKLSRCSALVLPSVTSAEAFGMVQVEAMSYGKPIINTNLKTGVPWVARDQLEALTVEPNDVNALAAALSKLKSDLVLRKKLGNQAKIRWSEEFTLQSTKSAFLNALPD